MHPQHRWLHPKHEKTIIQIIILTKHKKQTPKKIIISITKYNINK